MKRCFNCRFWEPQGVYSLKEDDNNLGDCRVKAPVLIMDEHGAPRAFWPPTNQDFWCAEHETASDDVVLERGYHPRYGYRVV